MTAQPPEAGDLRQQIAGIIFPDGWGQSVIEDCYYPAAKDRLEKGRADALAKADRILALSPAPSQGDVEAVARALDPAVWADDLPALTRAEVEAFHQARQRSCEQARRAIAAMPVRAGAAGDPRALAMAVKSLLPIGDPKKPNSAVFPIYVRMSELRALHEMAALSDDDGKEGR